MADQPRDDARWALVLGATSGAGAAICKALAQSPGLNIFGMHRGNHPDGAAEVEAAVRAAGREIHWLVGDAGRPELIAEEADAVLARVGKQGVHIMVHSLANASVGRLASGPENWIHPKQVAKTFDSMAHSFVYWTQALLRRELLAPGARIQASSRMTGAWLLRPVTICARPRQSITAATRVGSVPEP